jgi:hypothetical protein
MSNGNVSTCNILQIQETNPNHALANGSWQFEKTNAGHGVGIGKNATSTTVKCNFYAETGGILDSINLTQ